MRPAAVLVALFVAACGSAPVATTRTDYVPWLPLAPQHLYVDAPPAQPVPPIPVPPMTPACHASQLEGVSLGMSGAAGNVNMPLLLRNRGGADCYLEGYPDATVLAASGTVLASAAGTTGRGTYFNDGPVVQVMLKAGTAALPPPGPGYTPPMGEAFLNFSWYACKPIQASRLALDLPGGGGRLVVPFAMQAYFSAACDASSSYGPAVFRGPISPTGVQWPPAPDYLPLDVSLDSPPAVRRGTTLEYFVTVRNAADRGYSFRPCADYVEIIGAKQPVATYQLNCTPVPTLAPGTAVRFQMKFAVPAGVPAGGTRLVWSLNDGRVSGGFVQVPIEVT